MLVKDRVTLHKQHRVDAAVILAVVCDLSPATPDDLATGGDEAELGDVDFDDCAFGEDAELCVPEEAGSVKSQGTSLGRGRIRERTYIGF